MLLLVPVLACAHRAPVVAAPTEPVAVDANSCAALLDEALTFMDTDKPKADAGFAAGYERCGAGYGFLEARTFVAFGAGRWDDGGEHLLRAFSEPGPRAMTMRLIVDGMQAFSPAMVDRVRALGRSAEAPVYVPDIGAEYAWASLITCGVEDRLAISQALVPGRYAMLDRMEFRCPESLDTQVLYFDYSADPMERAFKQELEAAGKK